MLVPDTLDIVLAITVAQQRGAFEGFNGRDLDPELPFQIIACGQRAARARGANERAGRQIGVPLDRPEDRLEGRTGYGPVHHVVAEFAELIEDHVLRILREAPAGVVDLLDIALGP